MDAIDELIQTICDQTDAPNEIVKAIVHTHIVCSVGQTDGDIISQYSTVDVVYHVLKLLKTGN